MLEQAAPPRAHIFRFETIWLSHPKFNSLIQNKWLQHQELLKAINNFTISIHEWNHITFGNIFIQKKQLLARLNELQASPHYPTSQFLQNLEQELIVKFNHILKLEEEL